VTENTGSATQSDEFVVMQLSFAKTLRIDAAF